MPAIRKRRQEQTEQSDSQSPEPAPTRRRRSASNANSSDNNGDDNSADEDGTLGGANVMVKKLVRLALASEYSRQPLRRTDISQKVLGEHGARQFKPVFAEAQRVLQDCFGMQMVEQPLKEKLSISQRRAAQRVEKPSTSSNAWYLTTTLPLSYRTPTILTPARAQSTSTESTYTALYTFLISILSLSGGALPEQKLERYLRRVSADTYTPLDRTDRVLARMCKDGYLVRHRDIDAGEETIEYHVGPRGKVEVGVDGVSGLAREVYGFGDSQPEAGGGGGGDEAEEEFERKLRKSLGIRQRGAQHPDTPEQQNEEEEGDNDAEDSISAPRRSRRHADSD